MAVKLVAKGETRKPPDVPRCAVLFVSRAAGQGKGMDRNAAHSAGWLWEHGVCAHYVQVENTGEVGPLVAASGARHVVLMALLGGAEDLLNLSAEFPAVRFYVKIHSNPQFLCSEAGAWRKVFGIGRVNAGRDVWLAGASACMADTLRALGLRAVHLPNVWHGQPYEHLGPDEGGLHVGLFGSIRPLKNITGQLAAVAVAAEEFRGNAVGITLHVNGTRSEGPAADDIANLDLFSAAAGVRLRVYGWLDWDAFRQVCRRLDVMMQCSFTETFNYVAADAVMSGCPVIGSPAIDWLPSAWQVNPDDVGAMATALVHSRHLRVEDGQAALALHNEVAGKQLLEVLA